MKGKLMVLTAALAGAAALVVVPLTSASRVNEGLQIGYNLHFVGGQPGATTGTWIATGAVNDSGTVTSRATATPYGNDGDARGEGTLTLVGQKGTITEEFKGVIGPVGAPHEAFRGTFRIVDGTGAYADLRGHGKFLVVADFSTNQAIRTDDGQAND